MSNCSACGHQTHSAFCEMCGNEIAPAPQPGPGYSNPQPWPPSPPQQGDPRATGPWPPATPHYGPDPATPPVAAQRVPKGVAGLNLLLSGVLVLLLVGLTLIGSRLLSTAAGGWSDFAVPGPRVTQSADPNAPATQAPWPPATTDPLPTQVPGAPPVSSTGAFTESEARTLLEAEAAGYSITTDGHYLVVLSAKYVGLTDPLQTAQNGTTTFYFTDIVAEYREKRAAYGSDVHLVKSTSFGKQSTNTRVPPGESMYLTIYDPGTFGTLSAAHDWCAAQFPALTGTALDNACLARTASAPHS